MIGSSSSMLVCFLSIFPISTLDPWDNLVQVGTWIPERSVSTNILSYSVKYFLTSTLLDIAMGDTGVRRSIISKLTSQFPGIYTNENIAFVGTHQHSGVGGYLENLLPQITSLGYVKQSADAIVTGTVLAVQRAHANLAPGRLSLGNTTILDANINRSPTAYLQNPVSERARYEFDQDKDMTLLRFDDDKGNARGFLSFFAVHGTSLYEVRTYIRSSQCGISVTIFLH